MEEGGEGGGGSGGRRARAACLGACAPGCECAGGHGRAELSEEREDGGGAVVCLCASGRARPRLRVQYERAGARAPLFVREVRV